MKILLEASHIKMYIKERLIFDIENIQICQHDRIGLVGRNGSGKTTLLEVLAGSIKPESGTISVMGSCELIPQLKRTNTTKSGGELTQEYIHQAFLKNPEILFADEPTTNLDTAHIEWLEKKMKKWSGSFILVSHDREFLDRLCTKIWEIEDGKVNVYKGNYSDYRIQKQAELDKQKLEYEKYVQKKKQLESALKLKAKKAERAVHAPKKVSASEAKITGAKPYFAKKQKKLHQNAKAIETRLEKLEKVEKMREIAPIKMNLPNEESFNGRIILRIEELPGLIGQRVLWKAASFDVHGGDKLAIIGANGCGKTTLVKKIVEQAKGVSVSPAVKIGYFSQNLNILDIDETILENVSSTSKQTETFIRTVLARLHFLREDVYKPVAVLSGGELVKVAFAKLFLSDINTIILDEPTNYLDISSVEALESLLQDYEGTIIFVSHDRRFIKNLATRILEIKNGEICLFEGTFSQYQSFVPNKKVNRIEETRMIIELKLSEVLSRLSMEPNEELESEFQRLLKEKRKLENES